MQQLASKKLMGNTLSEELAVGNLFKILQKKMQLLFFVIYKGFGTIWTSLEEAGMAIARSASSATVETVQHRYVCAMWHFECGNQISKHIKIITQSELESVPVELKARNQKIDAEKNIASFKILYILDMASKLERPPVTQWVLL